MTGIYVYIRSNPGAVYESDFAACSSGFIMQISCRSLECGVATQDPEDPGSFARVVNGHVAAIESWPWMVSLRYPAVSPIGSVGNL